MIPLNSLDLLSLNMIVLAAQSNHYMRIIHSFRQIINQLKGLHEAALDAPILLDSIPTNCKAPKGNHVYGRLLQFLATCPTFRTFQFL